MRAPVPGADFFRDQAIGGLVIGDAQQRLGQAHQRNPLFVGQPEFLEKGIQGAGLMTAPATALNPRNGRVANDTARRRIEPIRRQQLLDDPRFVGMGLAADLLSQRC